MIIRSQMRVTHQPSINHATACLLILGMHRSGTSALSRVLNLAGAALPKGLIEAGRGNDAGHWEPKRLVERHDELLDALDSNWHDWRALNLGRLSLADRHALVVELTQIIKEEFQSSNLFVLKDPRICRFVPLTIQALEANASRVAPVLVIRNPKEVIASLRARDAEPELSLNKFGAALLWLRHTLDAEIATRSVRRAIVSYDALLSNWRDVLHTISKDTGVLFPNSVEAIANEIGDFLSREQRHHEAPDGLHTFDPSIRDLVGGAYCAMRKLEADPSCAFAHSELDRIRAAFNASSPIIEAVESSAAAKISRLRKTQARLERELSELRFSHEAAAAVSAAFEKSTSWRITAPLRAIKLIATGFRPNAVAILRSVWLNGGVTSTARKTIRVLRNEGISGLQLRIACARKTPDNRSVLHSSNNATLQLINARAALRRDVLLQSWHIHYVKAIDRAPEIQLPHLTVSVVLLNADRWLPGFIKSLLAQNYPTSLLNLVFVDHGSTDCTLEELSKFQQRHGRQFATIKIHRRVNGGYGSGNDVAIRDSNDEFVLVTNVDVEFHPNSITTAVSVALGDNEEVASWELRQCPLEHPKYYDPVLLQPSWSSHACVLLRRSAYIQVGGYEKRLFMYGEDVEFSYRLRRAGFELRYVPGATVTHFVDLTDTKRRPSQLAGSLSANLLLRHRYGADEDINVGDLLFDQLTKTAFLGDQPKAIADAVEKVRANRPYFSRDTTTHSTHFPFCGFDYDLVRKGHEYRFAPPPKSRNQPLVSVITRTHGDKTSLLSEAIVSVLNQTYRNIEHIVVEDRSKAARHVVSETASRYRTNIKYVESDGSGRSRAGNLGLEVASGELLMFLDYDDLLFPDHVELLADLLMKHRDAPAAYALAWQVSTKRCEDSGTYEEFEHIVPPLNDSEFDASKLQHMNHMPIQSVLFRRSVLQEFGGFHEDLDQLEDWNLWVRYAQAGDFRFLPRVTSLYRVPHDTNEKKLREEKLTAAYEMVRRRNRDDTARNQEVELRRRA